LRGDRAQHRGRQPREVDAVEPDPARGRLDQAQDRPSHRRLAAARLADQRERLAAADLEIDAVHRAHVADRAPEQPLADRNQVRRPSTRSSTSRGSRSFLFERHRVTHARCVRDSAVALGTIAAHGSNAR